MFLFDVILHQIKNKNITVLTDQPYNLIADPTTVKASLSCLEVNSGSPVGSSTARLPRLPTGQPLFTL